MDKNGLAIINMNIFQQMARRKVLNMLKIPIILFCFGISAIISAFEQSWLITTISCLGIILTCIEYRWELKNFKNFHEFALKFWHSSFVWKKNNRPPLPKYHEYNPKLFTAKKGVSHPRPTQLEIAKIRINEEYDSKIYLIENDFNANGYDFDISRNDTEPWRFVKIEELNKERNEKLDNLEKLDEKDCAAEIIASEARLKEFRLDNLHRILHEENSSQ